MQDDIDCPVSSSGTQEKQQTITENADRSSKRKWFHKFVPSFRTKSLPSSASANSEIEAARRSVSLTYIEEARRAASLTPIHANGGSNASSRGTFYENKQNPDLISPSEARKMIAFAILGGGISDDRRG
mmetsp:Transcript_2446/g.4955  ORF Transcript_2446/g.4955 Transcript_2446/m.4955 type:complete len:129 (+) Transcript_2446:53-439(+)|eukprot:CAMPEP_0181295652 /NCGR_PEP_ID=MMETSP1101-20121128/4265_1 /TAXON_ID=46948 /ORGANISM="Rhodomonas abbreviata, Strain Caron Lab Isolate" /LENGTH=128 /DNA_ID=CAMNT_0023400425 /DNA_START=50 /DNA_END=436 /DNA_ORIENTATION=-